MKSISKWLVSAAALATLAAMAVPASAQPFGYGDDGPPPFRRGPGWDGRPHWGPWDRWHHQRRWGNDGPYRRGWRDEGRGDGRGRFGRDEGARDQRRLRNDDGRRQSGGDDGPRRGGPGRGGPGAFGGNDD